MTNAARTRGPGPVARRFGYAVAVLVGAALLYLINVWPGWQVLPFLTEDTRQLLGIVNLSLIVGIIVNLVNLLFDATWFKALGDLITLGIGMAVLVQIWQVFPFDFGGSSFDWALLVRWVLVLAMVGTAIGIIVQVIILIRTLARPRQSTPT
jgi:hypothetical protein